METPGGVAVNVASCRASVERGKDNTPTSQLKFIGGKKHGSNSENQNQVKGL